MYITSILFVKVIRISDIAFVYMLRRSMAAAAALRAAAPPPLLRPRTGTHALTHNRLQHHSLFLVY